VANHILTLPLEQTAYTDPKWETFEKKKFNIWPSKQQIQEIMTNYVGIQRTEAELIDAVKWFETYQPSFWDFNVKDFTIDEIEIINLLTVGWLIASSALKRTESRGGHFRLDYPESNDNEWKQKQIFRTRAEMYVGC
jgi:L-aspartate oxidase